MDFLDHAFGQTSIQEVYAELEKAGGDYDVKDEIRAWAGEQKKIMDSRSPTGMAVALEGYRQAKQAKRLDITLENGRYKTSVSTANADYLDPDMSMATGFAVSVPSIC